MVLQTDKKLFPAIYEEGCLFLDYLYIASKIIGHTWTPEQVNLAYLAFVYEKWMQANCRILQPDKILGLLGVELDGWIRHEKETYERKSNEIEIEKWFNSRTGHTHFIVGDPYRWDSLGESVTVREGTLQSKVVVRLPKKINTPQEVVA